MKKYCTVGLLIASLTGLGSSSANAESTNRVWRNPKDGMEFVWIPAGKLFLEKDPTSGESASMTTGGFWLGRTEVTIRQFRRFVRECRYITDAEKAGHKFTYKSPGFRQGDDHPVVFISVADSLKYAEWAGVDLPTEVEWLYACRAGTDTRFYWGEHLDDRYLWYRDISPDGTQPVAHKLSSPWGLFDMIGNVREYVRICGDQFAAKGESWTRCSQYRMRDGRMVAPLNDAAKAVLTDCSSPQSLMYPYDDDRGFRCIKRPVP